MATLLAQDIIDATSQDVRGVLANSGAPANILLDYVDRAQKDVLHTSFLMFQNLASTSITTTPGNATYTLGVSPRRITGVYNRTNEIDLIPVEAATAPILQQEKATPPPGQPEQTSSRPERRLRLRSTLPEYYRHVGLNQLVLFPAPLTNLVIEITYEQRVPDVSTLSTPLTVDSDAKDMLVAGVNYYAFDYLKYPEEAQLWKGIYEQLKLGASPS